MPLPIDLPDDFSRIFIYSILTLCVIIVVSLIQLHRFHRRMSNLQHELQHWMDSQSHPNNKQTIPIVSSDTVTLVGTTKESITLAADNLLYIASESNYVKVVYVDENGESSKMLRQTLKEIAIMLISHPHVIRCHRAFMVNLHQIDYIESVGGSMIVSLKHSAYQIPVSRAYMSIIRQRMAEEGDRYATHIGRPNE